MATDDAIDVFAGARRPREDRFQLRTGGAGSSGRATSGALGGRLTKLLSGRRLKEAGGVRGPRAVSRALSADARQRVIVKVGYVRHRSGSGGDGFGGGKVGGAGMGSAKLLAHGRYLERDGAGPDGEKGRFYDREQSIAEDAHARLRDWSAEDPRHFRLVLAPESGARIGDAPGFTRDVMARIERDLGVELDWLAVDHVNTDNPHTHVILRGVRRDGVELRLPRAYVAHGLRESAREVATEWLGPRGIEDERLARTREVEARSLTRLDRMIDRDLDGRGEVRLQRLGAERDPALANALRARARELEKQGLARETRRNVLRFERDWLARLEARRAIDLRRTLARGRLYEPRMGVVRGEVLELGPRGDHPDRAALVIDAGPTGRLLLNTSMEAIGDLQAGSLVALHPEGRRARIERLAFHPVRAQAQAIADTPLDRELDRRARGERAILPDTESVARALRERALAHERGGLGVRDADGVFRFRDGVRDALQQAEREAALRTLAQDAGLVRADAARAPDAPWTVRGVIELHAGRTAVLARGRSVELAPLAPGQALQVGDRVAFRPARESGRGAGRDLALSVAPSLDVVKKLSRGLGLGR